MPAQHPRVAGTIERMMTMASQFKIDLYVDNVRVYTRRCTRKYAFALVNVARPNTIWSCSSSGKFAKSMLGSHDDWQPRIMSVSWIEENRGRIDLESENLPQGAVITKADEKTFLSTDFPAPAPVAPKKPAPLSFDESRRLHRLADCRAIETRKMISLRDFRYAEHMSEETNAFTTLIYVLGKQAGQARNDGHGGMTFVHWDDRAAGARVEESLSAEVAACLGAHAGEVGFRIDNLIDSMVEDEIDRKKQARAIAQAVKSGMVPVLVSADGMRSIYSVSKANAEAFIAKQRSLDRHSIALG